MVFVSPGGIPACAPQTFTHTHREREMLLRTLRRYTEIRDPSKELARFTLLHLPLGERDAQGYSLSLLEMMGHARVEKQLDG